MRASAALLLILAGCPGTLENPERFREGFCPDIPGEMFPQRCAATGCHGGLEPAAMLDLQSPGVAARLAGVPAAGDDCSGMGTLADPADPEASLLYTKTLESPPCGARMPMVGAPLTEHDRQCLLDWIATLDDVSSADAGAPD
jgi:hypothetical protein